jgi:hypothetical protein
MASISGVGADFERTATVASEMNFFLVSIAHKWCFVSAEGRRELDDDQRS